MTKKNTSEVGKAREREFLSLVKQSRMTDDWPDIPDPDRHLDAPEGQLKVRNKSFDFAWIKEMCLVEVDGGQWVAGGGRHNSDGDRWKTNDALAEGWIVMHYSHTQMKKDPTRMLRQIAEVLGCA